MRDKRFRGNLVPADCSVPDSELSLYRDYTIAMLRRYFRMSIELGRLPSAVGREFFRSKVTSYRMHSFEDVVVLVHDVEKCLSRLDDFSQKVIARVVLQEYTQGEAAVVLGCNRRTVVRRLPDALDRLSKIFLATGLLRALDAEQRGPRRHESAGETPRNGKFEIQACCQAMEPCKMRVSA